MQAKSNLAVAYQIDSEETAIYPQDIVRQQHSPHTQEAKIVSTQIQIKPRELKVDQLSAAVIYGLTGAFIAYLFGMVTDIVTRAGFNILLSLVMGICIGFIAYALMLDEE